jgi:cytochrome c peroxidase
MKFARLSVLAVCLASSPVLADELRTKALEKFKPLPTNIPVLNDNEITAERVTLGKALFFDPRLSASGVFSCNSCHNLGMGGDDNQETSIGHGWQKGPRNSPTVLNAVLNAAQFWDGRADDLKTQAKGPIQASVEMANTPAQVEKTLITMPGYVAMFKAAFPDVSRPVTFDNMAKAIEAFEATLLTPAPFDRYLNGDDAALTDEQKEGLSLFMSKGCVACHNGVNVGGHGYYPFGVIEKPGSEILPPDDKGRFTVTQTASDSYVYRAAPLRNIALTAPYFHSGKVWDLKQAVGIMGNAQLGQELSDLEVNKIVSFLKSLTGRMPEVTYPELPLESSATPRPSANVKR